MIGNLMQMATAGGNNGRKDGGNPMDMLNSVMQMATGGNGKGNQDMVGNLVKMGLDALLSDKKPADKKAGAKKTTAAPKKTTAAPKKTETKKPVKETTKAKESAAFGPALELALRALEEDKRSHQRL